MNINQAVIVTDKNHPKFDKGGIVMWKFDGKKIVDLTPDFIVGFVDNTQYFLNSNQIKEA